MILTYRSLGLHGRLGNALFELAATVGAAETLGASVVFPGGWQHRQFFSVPDSLFGPIPSEAIEVPQTELVSHMDPRARSYLQDVDLFLSSMEKIRGYFQPSHLAAEVVDAQTAFAELPRPILAVHARRGDNVYDPGIANKYDYYVTPTLDFYLKEIAEAREKWGVASVAVFSDDIPWCRENIPADFYSVGVAAPKEHEPDFLTAETSEWVDLFLMGRCDAHVLTGCSTFGIWGALLADSRHVVYSSPAYGPMLSYIDASLMYPKEWEPITVNQLLPDGSRREPRRFQYPVGGALS